MTKVLVADIGGTHARFALAGETGISGEKILKVADFPGVADAARAYLSQTGAKVSLAAFALAGPVTGNDRFELTNFNWAFSIEETRKALGLDRLFLVNDFHAMALGVLSADAAHVHRIGGGAAKLHGNIGVIGPGTGLGVGSLVWDEKTARYIAAAGEGGHVTVPTPTRREHDLILWLMESGKYTHISAERVCSGKGLVNLYNAIRGLDGRDLPERLPEEITAHAISGDCDACREALILMLGILGRVAGNLALTNMTTGGVYLAGGILPRIGLPYLQASRLRGEFIAKGRQTALVDEIPLFMADDPFLALKGLRRFAVDDVASRRP